MDGIKNASLIHSRKVYQTPDKNERRKTMFKKFIEKILNTETPEEGWTLFNSEIDIAFQEERITWKEHQTLLALITKIYG